MALQRRDAVKSLISIGLTVAMPAGAQGKTMEISMTDSAFVPPTITINAGDEATRKNPGDLSEDGTFTHVFTEKETYTYVCKYHESMGIRVQSSSRRHSSEQTSFRRV